MCGIAGCVLPPGTEPDRDALARMAAVLRHRGPDDAGVEVVGSVGLVHTRLSIVDPSEAGHQPMAHPGAPWWITYNGEVFNHPELRSELGASWRGGSDTETVLHALARWGEAAVPRFNGLYAFAALDAERRRLLLVRDRFGVKPLYLTRHAGGLWFASEMRALLAAGLPPAVRRETLAHSVVHGWANGRRTPLEGIERVLPGTVVEISLDTLATSERRWYEPAQAVDPERAGALARRSRAELADAVETELRASVGRRLMADVPVGTMCSGGLDSSLVTAFAREQHPRIVTFNASVADQPEVDEGPWAERVASGLEVELRTVRMTAEEWRRDLVGTVLHNEYPLMHESSVPMAQIAGLAREAGVKVLLSGEGADELFGGYGFLHAREYRRYLQANRRVATAARLAAGKLRRDGPAALALTARAASARTLRRLRGRPEPGGPESKPPGFPGPGASPDASAYELERRALAAAAYEHSEPSRRPLEAGLLGDLEVYLPHLLNRQDKNTMQRSIETRVPFLDPAVVALALNMPLEARVEPRRKGVLRDLGRRHLPRGVAERRKVGFGFDAGRYITAAARPDFLAEGMLRETLGVPREAWDGAVRVARGHDLLRLWTAEIYCRAVPGGQSAQAVEDELWR